METLFLTLMQFVFERLPAYISINLILSKNYKLNSKLKRHIFFDLYKMYLKLILLFYYYTNSSNIFGYIYKKVHKVTVVVQVNFLKDICIFKAAFSFLNSFSSERVAHNVRDLLRFIPNSLNFVYWTNAVSLSKIRVKRFIFR